MFNTHLTMVGMNTEAIIDNITITFNDVMKLHIENLTLSNGLFHLFETPQVSLFSVTLINYVIYIEHATQIKLHNCKFTNEKSQLIIRESEAVLTGNSKFFSNYNSAFISYSSTITFSGRVSFINNTGIRGGAMTLYSSSVYLSGGLNISFINNSALQTGGAMALYSSTVHLSVGLNISFINNSALQTGGAIHTEPDMTHNDQPKCFYSAKNNTYLHPGNCQQNIFYYSENLAQLGGDNIYGTSLALCKNFTCTSNVFASNVSISSVSSDPIQVCLCGSDNQPQGGNTSEILTSKSVHRLSFQLSL